MAFISWRIRKPNPLIGWVVLVGAVVGALAGWIAAGIYVSPRLLPLNSNATSTATVATTTPATPNVQIVPVTTQSTQASIYPGTFAARGLSPVLTLVKKTAVQNADLPLSEDQEIGRAVALTSDGWLVTTYAAIRNIRVADLQVAWQGKVFAIDKAVRDAASDAVFLKTSTTGLPVTALVDPADLSAGSQVWLEPDSGRLYPETLIDLRAPAMNDPVSSERAVRRLLVTGAGENNGLGGALWNAQGQLIGLLESKSAAGWRVLPASDLRTALNALLAGTEIRHASLGVRASDLSSLVQAQTSRDWPERGAWLRADKTHNLPAVSPTGPSAKLLRDGDVIDRIERDVLDGTADLGERLLDYKPGAEVTLYGTRDGQPFQVSVTLGSVVTGERL